MKKKLREKSNTAKQGINFAANFVVIKFFFWKKVVFLEPQTCWLKFNSNAINLGLKFFSERKK